MKRNIDGIGCWYALAVSLPLHILHANRMAIELNMCSERSERALLLSYKLSYFK